MPSNPAIPRKLGIYVDMLHAETGIQVVADSVLS
jgi:hypothetical protein